MEAHPREPFRTDLADVLLSCLPDILEKYETALRIVDSPLLKDDVSREQCLTHAREIVARTAQEISGRERTVVHVNLARDIGATRAATGVHPSESLRAADRLFSATVHCLSARLKGGHIAEQITMAALTLHEVLARVLRAAADSFAGVLLNRVHQAQVEERRRVSRELHDRIGHGISVAQRNLELSEIYRPADAARANARVATARRGLLDTMDAVRTVISELRLVEPMESLEKALKLFLDAAAGAEISRHIEVNGDETWAPNEKIEETFLIVREALRNAVAHADPRRIAVRIDITPDELRASVVDDGRGFDPAVGRRGGTGLLSMRERAALLAGTVTFSSAVGQGTAVELWLPLTGGTS